MNNALPSCRGCGRRLKIGDALILAADGFFHVACLGGITALAIQTLLEGRPGLWSCHTCIARSLMLDFEDVAKAVTSLRLTPGVLEVGAHRCSLCGLRRVVVRANGGPAAAADDPRSP